VISYLPDVPVIVVGADTSVGGHIVERFAGSDREVRAFVTDATVGAALRDRGVKVAVGDVSDDSHLAGACLNCFSAVLVMEAATDDRVRSFAADIDSVLASWAAAVTAARVRRVIWVGDASPPPTEGREVAVVSPARSGVVDEIYRLDEVSVLD
jgi:putative NADH-flavin reductase